VTSVVIDIPEALEFLREPMRYKGAFGGRGSAKSWSFSRALLESSVRARKRILCTREVQKSIRDSVYKLLVDQIEGLGLGPFFQVLQTEIRGPHKSEFLFAGLSSATAESIKSFEGVDIVWVEEAQAVSNRSWELLIPTIRKPGSEIWFSMNPDQETDPSYQRFILNPPPNAKVVKVNWDDNPWFPEELRREKDYLYRVDPEAAAHVWGGECRRVTDAQVLRGRFRVEAFEPGRDWDGPYHGADWGFAVDPTALVKCWVHGRTLYVEHEAYGVGVEVDQTPSLFDSVPGASEHTIRADSARPETISFMQRHGYPKVVAAAKGPGSVEDGVEYLRSFEVIVIHPRCKNTAQEARLWSYKTDRLSGDVLPVLVDKHNHCWDAIRYALEPISRTNSTGLLDWMRSEQAVRDAEKQEGAV
jgi:phage terminase large subunit